MVDDVLQHGHAPRARPATGCREQVAHGRERRAVHGRERPAVQVEPGDRLEHVGCADVHRDLLARAARGVVDRQGGDVVGEVVEPALGHEERPRAVSAASARRITVELSAMYSPFSGSCLDRSATSVRRL